MEKTESKKRVRFHSPEETDKVVKKKQINKTSAQNLLQNNQQSNRKKWNQTSSDAKSGQFSQQEINTLQHAICQYLAKKGLTHNDIQALINNKRDKNFQGAWAEISEQLPQRSVYSIHKFVKRYFSMDNYGGHWTEQEEQQLIDSVEKHGRKWEALSSDFNRTATNLRDKYRELGAENWKDRIKDTWSLFEIVSLIKLVEVESGKKFLKHEEKAKLKKKVEKNPEMWDLKMKKVKKSKFKDPHQLMDIIKNMIDIFKFKQNTYKKINWLKIASEMKTKSIDDCRNFWNYKIQNIVVLENDFSIDQEIQLLRYIIKQDNDNENEINFDGVENGKSSLENMHHWKILKKQVSYRNDSSIQEQVIQLLKLKECKAENNNSDSDNSDDSKNNGNQVNGNANQVKNPIKNGNMKNGNLKNGHSNDKNNNLQSLINLFKTKYEDDE